jgi:hypothetical protein
MRPLGRPGLEDDIKTDFKEIKCDGSHWIHLAEERVRRWGLVNTVMNLRVP